MNPSFEINFKWENFFTVKKNKIIQKENSEIEFKESFHSPKGRDKKLLKWMSSFANANGGIILFGVKNDGEIIGLKNKKLHYFDDKDLTEELLNFFSPEIKFEIFIKSINNVDVGFLYVFESANKPVIAVRSADNNIQEGDIYYRYPGQSRKIAYGELKKIIEDNYNKLNNRWLDIMKNIATIGVENVGILNTVNGELIGSNSKLLISEDLLKKVKFINEGEFVEKKGAPTLKVIGSVQPVDKDTVIQVIEKDFQIITHFELYNSFFENDININKARNFFRKVLYESSIYFPIYFYIFNSQWTKKELYEILNKEYGYNNEKIIERLKIEYTNIHRFEVGNIDTETKAAHSILSAYKALKENKNIKLENLSDLELRHILMAITHLKAEEYESKYIKKILKIIYDNYFSKRNVTTTFIRKAICHIDLIEFGTKVFKKW